MKSPPPAPCRRESFGEKDEEEGIKYHLQHALLETEQSRAELKPQLTIS